MEDMTVKYTTNDTATVVTVTVTANDSNALTVGDLVAAFRAVVDEMTATEGKLH